MRSRSEIEGHLDSCRKKLNDEFFGGTMEHIRYYRARVQFLEWVLGKDAPLMTLPNTAAAAQLALLSAKNARD